MTWEEKANVRLHQIRAGGKIDAADFVIVRMGVIQGAQKDIDQEGASIQVE